jgi:rhodanese-related sulfurtransferase
MMHTIDAVDLKQALTKNEVVLVDVREPNEYAEAYIKNAILQPLATVSHDVIPDSVGKKIVFYCRSGKRSAYALEQLAQTKPEFEGYNLEGGILAWIALGYPVESTSHTG